jgi:hypothetical protein
MTPTNARSRIGSESCSLVWHFAKAYAASQTGCVWDFKFSAFPADTLFRD